MRESRKKVGWLVTSHDKKVTKMTKAKQETKEHIEPPTQEANEQQHSNNDDADGRKDGQLG